MTMVVQAYLLKLREAGRVVSACIVVAAARGIVMAYGKFKLEEFGGYRPWVNSLLVWSSEKPPQQQRTNLVLPIFHI